MSYRKGESIVKKMDLARTKQHLQYGSWGSFNVLSTRRSMLLKYNHRKADTLGVAATSVLSRIRQAVSKQSASDTHILASWYWHVTMLLHVMDTF